MGERPSPAAALRVWCVSDGRAGIERQTLAVADALATRVPVERRLIRLTPGPPQLWLPPALWPAPMAALPAAQRAQLAPPWPDVWIGNGRRVIAFSLALRRWSSGRTLRVQLQDPRVAAARFDLVAPPAHDRLSGPNVVETFGAPVWHNLPDDLPVRATPPRRVIVILGGASKRHRFADAAAAAIASDLKRLATQGLALDITTSRRTPSAVAERFRALATDIGAGFFAEEARDGPNPYSRWLAEADAALVTEDSTSMLTDAAFFGLPIHLLRLNGGDAKFDAFHAALIAHGAARWFDGAVRGWTYPPIRDALKVADAILARI